MNLLALALWIAVAASSGLLLLGLRRVRPRAAGPAPSLHDLSEAAFMTGGPGNVVDTALVSMLGDGRLIMGGPGIVHLGPGARAGDPAERAVLQAHRGAPSGWLYQLRYAAMLDPAVQETGDALAARGLLSPPGWGRTLRRWGLAQAIVCGFLVPMSLPLTFVEFAVDPGAQVPFVAKVLPVLLLGILAGGICAARAGRRITPAGRRALRDFRARYGNDRTPHVQTALFGLRGLRDPYLRGQLVPAARGTRLAAAQSRSRPHDSGPGSPYASSAEILPVVWCAGSDGGGGGAGGSSCGSGSGPACGSSGGSCGGSGSSCSGGSSSCSGGSSSSCSSSSGSSCSSSSSS